MAKINETNYPRRQASEYASTDMFIVQPVPDPEQEHSGDSRTTRVSDLKDYILGDADPSKIGTPAAGTYTSASNTNAQNIAALDHALANYDHLTKQIATQAEINGYIADPTTASFNVIYLLKDASATGSDKYFEYQRLGTAESSTFEMTGDTSTDLSNYFTKAEINAALAEKMDVVNNKGSATKGVYFDANGAVQEMSYTVGKSVPSDAVFTDTDTKVTQTNTTDSAYYRVLLSENANDTTQTAGARKSANLKFNPSTGDLQTQKINGIAIGTTVSVTHTLSASANTNFDFTNIGADAVITEILATDGRGYASREYINSGTGIRFVFAPDSSTPSATMQIRYR